MFDRSFSIWSDDDDDDERELLFSPVFFTSRPVHFSLFFSKPTSCRWGYLLLFFVDDEMQHRAHFTLKKKDEICFFSLSRLEKKNKIDKQSATDEGFFFLPSPAEGKQPTASERSHFSLQWDLFLSLSLLRVWRSACG